MACRQRHELLAPAVEKRIGADDERAGMQLDEGREGGVDLAFGAGLQDGEPHARSRAPLPAMSRMTRSANSNSFGFTSKAITWHVRNQLGQQFEPLGRQLGAKMLKPVRLPPGRARLATRPAATGRRHRRRRSGSSRLHLWPPLSATPALATITSTLRPTKSAANAGNRSYCPSAQRYSIATFCPSMIAGFAQSLSERGHKRRRRRRATHCRESRSPASPSAAREGRAPTVIAPPRTRTSSRRLIRSPHRRVPAGSAAVRYRAAWRSSC